MTCDTPLSVIWCDKLYEVNNDVCDIRVSSGHCTLQCDAVRTDKQSTSDCMDGLKLITLCLSLCCVIRDVVDNSELLKMQLELQEGTRLSFVVYMWLLMFATAICTNYWLKVYLILWEEYNSLILI